MMDTPIPRGLKLRDVWQRAEVVSPEDLDGAYRFHVLSPPIPGLERLDWRKRFDGVRRSGYNELRDQWCFGDFALRAAGGGEDAALELDYQGGGSGWPLTQLRSEIRRVDRGVYLGRLAVALLGRRLHLAWYSLHRQG